MQNAEKYDKNKIYNHKRGVKMQQTKYNKTKEEKRLLEDNIVKHLLKAEDDIRKGKVRDAKEVFKNWKEEYGI